MLLDFELMVVHFLLDLGTLSQVSAFSRLVTSSIMIRI